jgi:hypothetical protein
MCQFIRDRTLKVGKRCPSRSTSSIIKGSTTLNMTSMSTATTDMGMRRNAATTLTVVDVTIATTTE